MIGSFWRWPRVCCLDCWSSLLDFTTEFAGFASFYLSACVMTEVHAVDYLLQPQILRVNFAPHLFLDESGRNFEAYFLHRMGIVAFA